MTTIVYRDGILAADSQVTQDSEAGGSRKFKCEKLYRKTTSKGAEAIIALAGESTPGLVFLDWYGTDRKPSRLLIESGADFTALVLRRDGLWEYDCWCRGERVADAFYAIGSGAKAALGAMHMGATAAEACEIATRIDPYSSPPIVTMQLEKDPQ